MIKRCASDDRVDRKSHNARRVHVPQLTCSFFQQAMDYFDSVFPTQTMVNHSSVVLCVSDR